MAHQPRLDDEALLTKLTGVFRKYGYEGTSLTRITKATGLQRSSLYHRFPGGKPEMVAAVLTRADAWFEEHVLGPLQGDGDPAARVRAMAKRLSVFYGRGKDSCLLDTLSVGDAGAPWHEHIHLSFGAWQDAMANVGRDAGVPARLARRHAEEALTRIQGALILARATGDTRPFSRVLTALPALLTRS